MSTFGMGQGAWSYNSDFKRKQQSRGKLRMVLLPVMENHEYFCKPQDPAELDDAEQQRP